MKTLYQGRHGLTVRLFTLGLLALQFILPAQAQEYGIIDDIDIRTVPQGKQIHISFTRPAQYIGHTPKEESRQLFIDLRLIGATINELQVPPEQQLRLPPSEDMPLNLVNYREHGRDGARLELNFTRPVRYTVSASNDFRGVTVTLLTAVVRKSVSSAVEIKASPAIEQRVKKLMQQARNNMIDERNFARAVSLYQQVLDQPNNSRSREALEMLGLARERLGQSAQAKAIYEDYLKRYPEDEDSSRVQQRLMSLITASLPLQKKLRTSSKADDADSWNLYGSFSQFYFNDRLQIDGAAEQTTTSALSTDLDLVAQRRGTSSNSRARITAGHYHDMENNGDGDTSRVSVLYAEHNERENGWWARAGRQSNNRDGALGRFDGLKLGYALTKRIEATVVTGQPVERSVDPFFKDSRHFTGIALDMGPFADNWEFSLYGIEQHIDSLIDRQGVGGEFRYFRPKLMVLGLADYDTFYEELNIGMLLANWTMSNDVTVNTTLDIRKSPLLTTRNALQGQSVADIEQLRALYTDDTIYQLARDRTTETRTFTLGLSSPLNQQLRIAGDLSMMSSSESVASGGVAALPATDDEYFLNLQIIGNGILNGDDISSVGIRYSDTTTATGIGVYASSRIPVGTQWRYYPRFQIDQREWKASNQSQLGFSTTLRAEYSWKKMRFEAEFGGEWINRTLPDDDERSTRLHGNIGYRYEF